ncbi:MAG TPA: hypothetical protein VHS05_25755 [Pyrinomonadaceae bacterium]|nr:hypothetical protein [Pyrinomonadaceae bacterium]
MISLLKAEFEHVQLSADYASRERLSRTFLNEFKRLPIADRQLPIYQIGNWQLVIGNTAVLLWRVAKPATRGEFNWQQKI